MVQNETFVESVLTKGPASCVSRPFLFVNLESISLLLPPVFELYASLFSCWTLNSMPHFFRRWFSRQKSCRVIRRQVPQTKHKFRKHEVRNFYFWRRGKVFEQTTCPWVIIAEHKFSPSMRKKTFQWRSAQSPFTSIVVNVGLSGPVPFSDAYIRACGNFLLFISTIPATTFQIPKSVG
jgi:hypothetical protein